MMAKKMAGLFAVLGVIVFLGNWLYSRWLPDNGTTPAMSAEKAWEIGIYLSAAFFLLGLFVSTLGIALVQEVLAESRSRDMGRKFKAKTTYDYMTNPPGTLSLEPAAEEGNGERQNA